MSPRRAATLFALLLATVATARPAGAEVTVKARLEPRELAAGGNARLVIEVRGGVFDRLRPRAAFDTRNLTVVAGPSRIENIEWVNGVTRRSVALVWLLRADEPGAAAVHSLVVEVEGDRYELPTITARVGEGRPGEDENGRPRQLAPPRPWGLPDPLVELLQRRWPPRRTEPPEIHLVAEATPLRVWNGEQILFTLYLYTQTDIVSISANRLPDFRGFWVEEVPRGDEEQRAERVEWRGEVFWRTALLQRVLFPLRPGRHVVEPAEVEAMPRPDADPWRANPALAEARPRTLASRPLTLDVLPLPPPPSDHATTFGGLVGRFDLAARVLPEAVAAGEAATLEVTLSGRGNLESIDAPMLPALAGFEILPAQEEGGNRIVGEHVEGRRVWRFPLVPKGVGNRELPPVTVSYFEPRSGEYRTASSRPLTLAVRPASGDVGDAGRHPIRSAALPADSGRPAWPRLVPWAFALPWLMILIIGLAARRRGSTAATDGFESALCRRFEEHLAAAALEQRPRQAARQIEEAWRQLLRATVRLGDELPPASWPGALTPSAAAEGRAAELARVVEDLHYLRFAPQLSAVDELSADLVERSRRLGRRLASCGRPAAAAGGPRRHPPPATASRGA
ncbi:MAG TPA: BatD family protein [Thermoanaerobaculia bacterium]|nr:BatD family protein [Thermoanaerobaculia bacterium]